MQWLHNGFFSSIYIFIAKNFKFHTTDTKSVVRVDVEPSGSETSESEDSCESDCPTDVLPAVESAGNIPGSCM